MNTFYTNLKDHVKDEIARGDRSDELAEMIKIIIHINNHIYKRQMKRIKRRTSF
jgi:predicted XRE-type DNA-binding protein